ncbi:MAG: fused MFS/spermidine synthase [Dehalococcoidales bacterium]|nr:fused MFS/spermidine synthase [Dehalococcoidales bacterium]
MRRSSTLWKAYTIAFISSFCVMVIELIASRILAPYIGVSLYTWTSIIGIILGGIALGNYVGGRIADRYASPLVLVSIFFIGGLATIGILPAIKIVTSISWFSDLPVMLHFTLKTFFIFFLPSFILSMVSPTVIKLALADLGQTGGVVGAIYAFSTAGSILGTFMTGFFFILWFGIRMMVWLVAGALILTGVLSWFLWKTPDRWRFNLKNIITWSLMLCVVAASLVLFQHRSDWQSDYTKESNYYSIRVMDEMGVKVLVLDHLIHSYVIPDDPGFLKYDYLKIFEELVRYASKDNAAPHLLHLGGGGYSLPRYLEKFYPQSRNEVVEIDPEVTEVARAELGLSPNTVIKTHNRDARLFLIQRPPVDKFDFVVGDVFNDLSTPYHLTTLEFDKLVKANMTADGIYMINIIDHYERGRYLPAFIHTLRQTFKYVYLMGTSDNWKGAGLSTYVIAATDRQFGFNEYETHISAGGKATVGKFHDVAELEAYLTARNPILLTDDHAPTDILVASFPR